MVDDIILRKISEEIEQKFNCKVISIDYAQLLSLCVRVKIQFNEFERKSKIVMREHFISNNDVENYNLYLYVHKDKYGRYKLSKYVFRNISYICEGLKSNQTEKALTKIDKKILKIDKNILKNIQTQRKLKINKLNKT